MRGVNLIFIALFVLILTAVPVATAMSPKKQTDDYEFRALQKRPVLTLEGLVSGDYMANWEAYFKDHFVKRDLIIKVCAYAELNLLKRTVVNNVFVSDGHVLPVIPYMPPKNGVKEARDNAVRIAEAARAAESYGGEFLFVGIPSQSSAFHKLYPKHVYSNWENQKLINDEFFSALDGYSVRFIDMFDIFETGDDFEDSYFKSDHHLNIRGAERVCRAITDALGVPAITGIDFYTKTDAMIGSRARSLYGVSPVLDRLEVFTPMVALKREDNGKAVAPAVLELKSNNYGVFMGGDIGETVIKTDRPELPNVLIYGASYTNAVEALIYQGFNEMRSIDPRSYKAMSIEEYILEYKPDYVVNITDDRSFGG